MQNLHNKSIVIDGLIISKWSRNIFKKMRKGGLDAANCTVSVWEGFQDTVNNIADIKQLIRNNTELVQLIRNVEDIKTAKDKGLTGIILGFQNGHAFEDSVGNVEAFADMGVRVVQLCYNTQNLLGTGCYERDGGLSDFGREIIKEMNRVGILIDLSHVGNLTSKEAIIESSSPVCYSHCLPAGLKQHPRNKSDEELKFIANHGGFVGVTMFPSFLKNGDDSTIEDYIEAIEYTINLVGEDSVGIGTDFNQGHDEAFTKWITHDKGKHRKLTEFHSTKYPKGIEAIEEWPNITRAMERAGWPEQKIVKVLGENWLKLFNEVWN